MSALFDHLPENFFAPLASPNRRHYAALLLRFYELFHEYHSSVARALVVDTFTDYLESLAPGEELLSEVEDARTEAKLGGAGEQTAPEDPRAAANSFIRRLAAYGWIEEEEMLDFTRVINLRDTARPFLEALHQVSNGIGVEYESHVVAIYSSLESDAVQESGQHAVPNAHMHTRLLMESLKLLDQNIRAHLQRLFSEEATIPELLHAHYDLYMHEVVDRAYTRLKTSDNLSRYRPRINRQIAALLADEDWLGRTAEHLSVINRSSTEAARGELCRMLIEIRNDLQAIDPLLERIDDRNRRYSRISTERIRSRIHSDQNAAGWITAIVRAWSEDYYPEEAAPETFANSIQRLRFLETDSLYTRRSRQVGVEGLRRQPADSLDVEAAEREIVLRARGQLSPRKVAAFLEQAAPLPGDGARAAALLQDMDSYIKLLYAGAYAEGRPESFPYSVEWFENVCQVDRFRIVDHRFVKRYPRG